MVTKPKILYEFGPFRVDPDKQLLLHENRPVPITSKAFEALLVLVRHSRQDLSKDELIKTLWPDTFVEETTLSQNIFRLRKALGETAEDRQYILTLPGRGYRFTAQVRTITQDEGDLVLRSLSSAEIVVDQPQGHAHAQATDTVPLHSHRQLLSKYLLAIGVAALLGVLGTLLYLRSHKPLTLRDTDSVLLADFANTTGDPVFNDALRQGFTVQLQQSPFLNLVSEDRIQETLVAMRRPADTILTPDVAREVCQRVGSAVALDGSIATLGNQYVLGLRARSCLTGSILDEEQAQAGRKEDVLDALSKIASKLRHRVGESVATIEKYGTPLAQATTPSLEALKAYSTGLRIHFSAGPPADLSFYKRAIEIDPSFAMAYAYLGLVYDNMGESEKSKENIRRAYELRNRANAAERFFISATYDMQVTGNLQKAQQTCEAWEQAYPRDVSAHGFLAGAIYPVLGKFERAIEESRKVVELDPVFAIGYNLVALNSQALGHTEDADQALRFASERKIEIPDLAVDRFEAAFLKNDEAAMDRELALSQKEGGTEDFIADQEAFHQAHLGHLQQARHAGQRAVDLARQSDQPERAALFEAGEAIREAFFGNTVAGAKSAHVAIQLSKGRDVEYGGAFALALAGDLSGSQILADDLARRFPEDTAVRFNYTPALLGLLAVKRGDPKTAIALLQVAEANELGAPPVSFYGFFGTFYPIYVRGEAYLALQRGAEAAAEFQKILDHRGIVLSDPISALAHLEQGRAYTELGDRVRVRAKYQDFFDLWKDADTDVPVLKQARREFAKVR